ncbi:MAG TPA: hypothetical protein VGM23_16085, partial [Armatimonadota bacterium]
TFNTDPTNLQELRLSMAVSERHWLLVVTNKTQAVLSSAQVEATRTASHIIWWGSSTGWADRITPDACYLWKLRVKWCDFPLNKVKDWVLDYDVNAVAHPHVFFDGSAIATAKTRLDTDPSYALQRVSLLDTQALEYIENGTVADLFRPNTPIRDDWDFGDATNFVKEQMDLGYASSCYVLSTGQAMNLSVLYADLLWNALPLVEKQRWSRYALALAYILRDNDNWRGAYAPGTLAPFGNFNGCRWSGLGLAGVMFQGHPAASEWRTFAQNEMDQETSTTISPDGVYLECLSNYMPFWWQNVGMLSMALQHNGYANYSTTPRYQKAVEFLTSTLTPPDATFHQDPVTHVGKRMIPPVGHHPGAGYRDYGQFAWSGNLLGQSTDPGGWAQWAWNQNGKQAGHHFRLPINLFIADPASRQVTYPLKSTAWDDYGFVFRNQVGTSRESYFLLKNSRVEWHHESDEGSFHFFGKGVLLAGDGLNLLSTDPPCTYCDTQKTDATDRVSQRSARHHNLVTFQGPTADGAIRGQWQAFKAFGAPVNLKADSASQNFDLIFSDDLQYMLTGSLDRCIRLWNPYTAKVVRTFGPGLDYMFATAISPNDQYVAGGNRNQIVLWNATTGAQLYSWATNIYWGGTYGTGQNALAFSPDSSRLAVACGDGHVRLYNTGTGALLADYNVQLGNLYAVAYAPDGLRLAIGSTTQVAIWDLTTGSPLIYLSQTPGWQDSGFAVSYAPDGSKVVVGGIPNLPQYTDAKVTVWDATVPNGQPTPFTRSAWIWRVSAAHGNFVNSVRFSPNGLYVASGANDARAYVFDAANGAQLRYLPVITDGYPYQVKDVAWSPDSLEAYVAQPMSGGNFRYATYYRTTITTPSGWPGVDYGHASIPKVSTAATPMAIDDSYNRRALLVKSKTQEGPEYVVLQDTTYGPDLPEWNLDVHSPMPQVNPNGKSGWVSFPGFSDPGFGVAMDAVFVSPGNPDIWTEQGHIDNSYQSVWNVHGHSLLHATPSAALGQVDYWVQYAHASVPYSAAISPDRKYVISGGSAIYDSNWNVIGTDYVVKQWDRKTGKLVRVFGPSTDIIFSCKISPNTQYIAAGNRTQVLVWNVNNGTQRFSLPTTLRYGTRGCPPNSLAFSADSGKLAVLCADGRLRIYNMSDGSEY